MKNVSNNFKNVISKGGPFYAYAKIVLRDGTELELDSTDDFYIDGNSYNESGGDGFPLGVALSKTIDIGIENSNERYSGYDFYYSRITLYTEADLEDGTKERILEGTFTVIDPVSSGDIIEITAADDMYKSDVPYTSKLTYPATTRAILQEACSQSGISLSSAAFENDDFTVQAAPQGLTCRQVIGYVAMIAGGNAVMSEYNQLIIKTYRFPAFDSKKILSGGRFDQDLKDMVSGGDFTQEYDNTISGGEFGENDDYVILSDFSTDPDISTDDVVITGIATTAQGEGQEEDQEFLYGTDDYAIKIENPLIEGKEETAITLIGDLLIGTIARPFSGEFFPDPTVQFMDPVYLVDRKDNIYQSFVTSLTFKYLGNNNISNGLQSPEMNKSTYYSTATEVYRKARQDLQKSKTEWEKAVENLGNRLDNASGLYPTEEKQPDGSTIYYLHDKPTLEESGVVIKITAQAIGISTDGGETYPTGLTVDGEAIIKILQTIGVNADWINTGAIQVTDDDGNIIFSVDMDTKQIVISGDFVQIGGKSASAAIDDALQESKIYSDGKLADFADTVTEDLSGLQAQIDGQIETFYEDYEPSLQNYPANEWTTTEERKKHEGDLFYWKSKGYAYRFFQDGEAWKWQLVQDTDITQAMAAAEKAQDTADGKRRVFVVTPQPPYDIGDLWANGTDILTCSTSRSAGSVYVSTDWEKLNTYTDDTVANEALEEAKKARSLNIILDNEYQGIYANSDGNIGTFPTVQTAVQVLYGSTDVSVDCTYSVAESSGVTGSWSSGSRTYTVTGLSTDAGWVDITANYLNLFTVTKRFNIEKIKGGEDGQDGVPGRTYFIEPSQTVLKQDVGYNISPGYIDFNAYYRDGQNAQRTAYSGRFKIEEEDSDGTWVTIYTSTANESSVRHILYDLLVDSDGSFVGDSSGYALGGWRDVANVRVTLYASGGTSTIIDQQTVPVVKDGEPGKDGKDGTELTPEDVFNILTNYGEVKGIYKVGNQLYISFTYARGGELVLGGANNGNGLLKILDASGNQVGYIDNTGVHFNKGTFSGSLSAATGSFSGTITSNNAIITGGYIGIITSTENYSVISLKSGSSFENAITPADIRIHYQDSFSKISGTGLATCDGNVSVYISPNAVYVSEDPSGIVPYNYARTAVFKDAIRIYDSSNTIKSFMTEDHITSGGDIYAWGNIGCSGEKSRIVDTENYSNRKLYSYEFSSPMFGDIGEGITDQNGECYVSFDDVFLESVNSNCEYQVFLQKEGQGDLWVEEKAPQYFLVKGTENLKFAWEVKVKQRDYEYERLEVYGSEPELEKISYETEGLKAVDLLTQEYIENSTFNVTEYYAGLEGMFI